MLRKLGSYPRQNGLALAFPFHVSNELAADPDARAQTSDAESDSDG
jgi:hypothetical protein